MTESASTTADRSTNRFMEATLAVRDGPGTTSRHTLYLSSTDRRNRELAITDPHLIGCPPRVLDVCLLAGAFRRVPDEPGVDVGAALRRLVQSPGSSAAEQSARTRLLSLMRQPWTAATATLRSILSLLDGTGIGVDWHQLAWAAHHWDDPTNHNRDCARWARSYAGATEPTTDPTDTRTEES